MLDEHKFRQIQRMATLRREEGEKKYGEAYWDKDMYQEAIEEHLDSINYNLFQIEKLQAENNPRFATIIKGHQDVIKVNFMVINLLNDLKDEYKEKRVVGGVRKEETGQTTNPDVETL